MAVYLSCVYFGDLDSYFILDCIVDDFAFQPQMQGTPNSRGKFCVPSSANRCNYQSVQCAWLPLLLHIHLQHVILPGNDFFLAAYGIILTYLLHGAESFMKS